MIFYFIISLWLAPLKFNFFQASYAMIATALLKFKLLLPFNIGILNNLLSLDFINFFGKPLTSDPKIIMESFLKFALV